MPNNCYSKAIIFFVTDRTHHLAILMQQVHNYALESPFTGPYSQFKQTIKQFMYLGLAFTLASVLVLFYHEKPAMFPQYRTAVQAIVYLSTLQALSDPQRE